MDCWVNPKDFGHFCCQGTIRIVPPRVPNEQCSRRLNLWGPAQTVETLIFKSKAYEGSNGEGRELSGRGFDSFRWVTGVEGLGKCALVVEDVEYL